MSEVKKWYIGVYGGEAQARPCSPAKFEIIRDRDRRYFVTEDDFDRVTAERDTALECGAALVDQLAELQQRLAAADEREDVLKGQVSMLLRELQELINDEDGILVAAELSTGFAWHSLQKHGKAIKATLKAAEGRGHD